MVRVDENANVSGNKLLSIMFFFTICVVYAFSTSRYLSITMQGSFVGIMILYVMKTKRMVITHHFLWMVSIITWGLFISLFAIDATKSIGDVINLGSKLLFYTAIVIFIKDGNRFHFVLKCIIFAGLTLVLRLIISTPLSAWGTERLGASLDLNPNRIGIVLAYASISTIYIANTFGKRLYYLLVIPFIIIGLLTGSRKAFLAIAGGVSFLLILSATK